MPICWKPIFFHFNKCLQFLLSKRIACKGDLKLNYQKLY
uniref:Uncharacterized protein n=1 Tax=Rhizophora mucronata TaxID=61149 RepID=A0A2P2J4R3_RHIMU